MVNRILHTTHVLIVLWGLWATQGFAAQICDVDNDIDIDREDIILIFAARNDPATGPDDPSDAGSSCRALVHLPRSTVQERGPDQTRRESGCSRPRVTRRCEGH